MQNIKYYSKARSNGIHWKRRIWPKCLCCPEFDFLNVSTILLREQREVAKKSSGGGGVILRYGMKTSEADLQRQMFSNVIQLQRACRCIFPYEKVEMEFWNI